MKQGKWIDNLQQVVRQKEHHKQKSAWSFKFYVYNTQTDLKNGKWSSTSKLWNNKQK